LGGVFGALAGGFIIETVGIDGQYLAISAMYALTAVVLLFTREAGQSAIATPDSVWKNLVGYFRLLGGNRTLMLLMMLAAITEVFGFTHQSLLPVLARDELDMGPSGLGIMGAFRQGGGMIGLIFLASLKDFRHKGMAMFVLAAGFGLGQMAFSLADDVAVFIVSLVVVNACASAVDTLYKMLMQSNVSNEERGRAMGSWVLSIGVAPVGHIGIGAMASAFGAPGALLVNGSILLGVSALTAIGMPKMRRLE
jgi:predicted MFS family arabinose efflux permease